ncbi:hypothetical protein Acr_25g0001600 [Actinidia rufa]|uniref:Uncharacterized protein n=1 Tax=Actinidia rufa TaxID=165716 RepID=A0A7J0GYA8_9ERIC|nr:hypothetical protein Acr_25g0001600 [Actinidia rufa]
MLDNGVNDNTQMAPALSDPEPILGPDQPASGTAATFEAEDINGAEVYDPSDNDEGSVLEEEVIDDPQTHSSQNEANAFVSSDPAPAQEEKKSYTSQEEKNSYASIVKVTKVVKASTPVYVPTSSIAAAPTNADQQSLGSAKLSYELEASGPSDGAPESTNAHEEGIDLCACQCLLLISRKRF